MALRTAPKVLSILALAVAAFAAGALAAVLRGWGSPLVFVMVQNNTAAEVRSVNLHIASCGSIISLTAPTLLPGQTHTFRFPVCGEGGYELEAAFTDGRTLKSEAYVESGYSVSEHVEPSRIRSQSNVYHL